MKLHIFFKTESSLILHVHVIKIQLNNHSVQFHVIISLYQVAEKPKKIIGVFQRLWSIRRLFSFKSWQGLLLALFRFSFSALLSSLFKNLDTFGALHGRGLTTRMCRLPPSSLALSLLDIKFRTRTVFHKENCSSENEDVAFIKMDF